MVTEFAICAYQVKVNNKKKPPVEESSDDSSDVESSDDSDDVSSSFDNIYFYFVLSCHIYSNT